MAAIKQFLADGAHEKFEEAVKLNDVESQNDPETDPYKSKYKAREIWSELKTDVENFSGEHGGVDDDSRLVILTAALDLLLGANYADTEELSTGEEHLSRCVEKLEPYRLDPRASNIQHNAFNQLGILWTGRRRPSKALEFLKKAESLYLVYQKEVGNAPQIVGEQFKVETEQEDPGIRDRKRSENFESTYTHTLYYLAQVYARLEDNKQSAEYCHVTLRRQLETMSYSPVDWSMNCATLSQYYITKADFHYARHCLASATLILRESGDPPDNLAVPPLDGESQTDLESREKKPKAWADLYRCAVKYAMALLQVSRDRLMEEVENDDQEQDESHNDDKSEEGAAKESSTTAQDDTDTNEKGIHLHKDKEGKLYFDLELTAIENQVTDQYVLTFDQAREVFLTAQRWLNSAREFYVLDGYCTDNVEVVQDHSKLYQLLAFFEPDFDRQSKMHKRRVDLLEGLLNQLSVQHYLLVCRQVMYECAEVYSAMLDIKLANIESHGVAPNAHAVKKINQLTAQSIKKYEDYVDTLKDADKVLPNKYGSDDLRPALIAHFCMGRLHSKFIQFEVNQRLAHLKDSIRCYQYVVDYVKQNPEAREVVKMECEICEELVTLLPGKMEKIRAESQT